MIKAIPLSRFVYGTIPCNCHSTMIKGIWTRVYCSMHAPLVLGRNSIIEN